MNANPLEPLGPAYELDQWMLPQLSSEKASVSFAAMEPMRSRRQIEVFAVIPLKVL